MMILRDSKHEASRFELSIVRDSNCRRRLGPPASEVATTRLQAPETCPRRRPTPASRRPDATRPKSRGGHDPDDQPVRTCAGDTGGAAGRRSPETCPSRPPTPASRHPDAARPTSRCTRDPDGQPFRTRASDTGGAAGRRIPETCPCRQPAPASRRPDAAWPTSRSTGDPATSPSGRAGDT